MDRDNFRQGCHGTRQCQNQHSVAPLLSRGLLISLGSNGQQCIQSGLDLESPRHPKSTMISRAEACLRDILAGFKFSESFWPRRLAVATLAVHDCRRGEVAGSEAMLRALVPALLASHAWIY